MKWEELGDREKDALVATKILGLEVEHWTEEDYKDNDPAFCYVTGWVVIHPPQAFLHWSYLPEYTQDWSAVHHVVEKMQKQLFSRRNHYLDLVQLLVTEKIAPDWKSSQRIAWPDTFWFITPEILCKAALVALGIMDEKGNIGG